MAGLLGRGRAVLFRLAAAARCKAGARRRLALPVRQMERAAARLVTTAPPLPLHHAAARCRGGLHPGDPPGLSSPTRPRLRPYPAAGCPRPAEAAAAPAQPSA